MCNMSSPKPTFLHQAGLFINKILARAGFQIIRSPRPRGAELIQMRIGKYQLLIHGNNPLWMEHAKNPEYTGQLARLARTVFKTHGAAYMIDVGANIGDTAALARSVVNVPIICIEGDPVVFELLKKNIAAMPEVTAYQCFLGERTEVLQVVTTKAGWDATLIPLQSGAGMPAKPVSLLTLDDFVKQLAQKTSCKLLKIDIEGFDLRALRGAPELLANDKPTILFEFNHQNLTALGENGLDIFPYLAGLGYEQLLIYDGQGEFMLSCNTSDCALLADLDNYARKVAGLFYYDICAFHRQDALLAAEFLAAERNRRVASL